jgi:hypothetical protein
LRLHLPDQTLAPMDKDLGDLVVAQRLGVITRLLSVRGWSGHISL